MKRHTFARMSLVGALLFAFAAFAYEYAIDPAGRLVKGDLMLLGTVTASNTAQAGAATLVSGTPSTVTVTVKALSKCVCAPVGTTAAIAAAGCAVSLSGTTLTLTGPNTVTTVINYWCF